MTLLVSLANIKTRFPLWNSYCATDAELTADAEEAQRIMLGYLPDLTAATITTALEGDYLNLVRKQCFDRKHGDREFEHKPEIIKAFERTIKRLDQIRTGNLQGVDSAVTEDSDPEDGTHITMHTKARRFRTWFNDHTAGVEANR